MRFKVQFLLVVLTVISTAASGGVNRWTSHGPEGGSVNAIVVDPTDDATVYAATNQGVYKSENGGALWKPITNGMTELGVSALMIGPEDHSIIFAGTRTGMIFQSRDGGQNWIELGQAGDRRIRSLAAIGQAIYAGTDAGLWRSRDGGANWEVVGDLNKSSALYFVAVSPAGDLFLRNTLETYLSQDGGETLSRLATAPRATAIAFGEDGSVYLAGAFGVSRSVDLGKTWEFVIGTPQQYFYISSLQISNTGRLYLGSYGGLFESEDHQRWVVPAGAADLTGVNAVAMGSAPSARLYVGARDLGVYAKIESSTDWMAVNRGIDLAVANDIAVAPLDPATVFAATQSGLFKSDDRGETWNTIDPKSATAVAVNPFAPNVVYAGQPQLKKSVDGGSTWKVVKPDLASAVAVAPSDAATLYAALAKGMSKSTDGGESWTLVMQGMPLGYYAFWYGFSASVVAVAPSNSSVVYVAQEACVCKTDDGGATWKSIFPAQWVNALAIDSSDSSIVYRGGGWGSGQTLHGVSKSNDGGANWAPAGLSDQTVGALVINPAAPSVLYAGTQAGNVYRSDSGGDDWRLFSDGLNGAAIRRLSIDSSGNYLYAATEGGVFQYLISQIDIDGLTDDSLRLPRLLRELLAQGASGRSGFVLPIAGLAQGINGTFFKTDLTLRNDRATDQDVLIAWLTQGNPDGRVPFFHLTLHPSDQEINVPNIVDRLGFSGLGSFVVVAVDGKGNLDSSASIDGSARICSQSTDQRPVCQSVAAARADLFAGHSAARAVGLRQDTRYRTNVGIANLDSTGHQFAIAVTGERHVETFSVFVPPFSLIQTAIPNFDYGALTVDVAADSTSAPWIFYGSSVDNLSGAGVTSIGTP
jgi:photosystem II stability/assembly factor-like uncharacterized protein